MPKTLPPIIPLRHDYVASLEHTFLDERHYCKEYLIRAVDGDVNVPKADGSPLLLYRPGALPLCVCKRAWKPLSSAARWSEHRKARSGIAGNYFDHGKPRVTAWTRDHPELWERMQPLLRLSAQRYKLELPGIYNDQMKAVAETDPRWIIPGTPFTTVTANRDEVFKVHDDEHNLAGTFAVMTALHHGNYEGHYLVWPRWMVAVDLRTCDLLFADVSELHGNGPVVWNVGPYHRESVVMYFRADLRGR